MKTQNKIPKVPHTFFKWYCRKDRYEELHGDLEELYFDRSEEFGSRWAKLYYLWDVIRCCQPYAWKKPNFRLNPNIAMLKNFYLIAVRNLLKFKSYTAINVAGLAIGMSSFVMISLYIFNELSYDRFHSDYQNIYRISNKAIINGIANDMAPTNSPLLKTLLRDYPQVVRGTRLIKSPTLLIGKGTRKFYEDNVLYTDSSFFEVFSFKLIQGNPKTALANPNAMVLTETFAQKYFGDSDPMGKQITVDNDTIVYTITGIVEDAPANSHIQFDMLGSIISNKAWNSNHWVGQEGIHAYVVLQEGIDHQVFAGKLQEVFYKYVAPQIEYFTGQSIEEWENDGEGNKVSFVLFPVADIHLKSYFGGELEASGNMSYIYIYAVIAIMILSIAIFNYVNMATSQAATRSKEVGVRKVMGSTKRV